MKGRALFVLALCGAIVAVACSFPDVTFSDAPIGNEEAGFDADATTNPDVILVEETGPNDAQTDVIDFPPDVIVFGDAGKMDGDAADPCDIDRDGYKAKGTVNAVVCNGNDCDDNDSRANPAITEFSPAKARPTANGDWNCNGTVQKQFPENQTCPALSLGACAQNTGFLGTVPCGEEGDYITSCYLDLVTCKPVLGKRIQGCL